MGKQWFSGKSRKSRGRRSHFPKGRFKTEEKFYTHDRYGRPIRNMFMNYIGMGFTKILSNIKDDSPANYPDEVQCDYVNPNNKKQCITLLNASSIKANTGRCDLHRDSEITHKWDWECTITVSYWKDGKTVAKPCMKPSYHRTCMDGVEVIRCPKHLKEHFF